MEEKIEHAALERDILELSQELRVGGAIEKGKEAIKNVIGEKIFGSPLPPEPNEFTKPAMPPGLTPSTSPLPKYAKELPIEARLKAEKLLDLAFHKGIKIAITEVKKSDPLTMDIFHDAITEKLYSEFKKRGILK